MTPIRSTASTLAGTLVLLTLSNCSFSTHGLGPEVDTTSSPSSTGADPGTSTAPATTGAPTTGSEVPTGTSTSTDASADTSPSSDSTSSGSDTTGTPGCIGDVAVNDCSGDTPYCVDMTCVSCEALSSCAEFEPTKPACEAKSGLCVECLANEHCTDLSEPICDQETATCGPCTEHEQCPATACNLETGECFPGENILYVSNEINSCSEKADHGPSKEKPLCTLSAAMKRAFADKPLTIKIRPGVKPQTLPAGLTAGNFIVAIVPQDAGLPSLLMVNSDFPALRLSSGNKVFMQKVGIQSAVGISGPAVECNDANLWLDRQKLFGNDVAIYANNCTLRLRRTVIFANNGGGLDIEGDDPVKANLFLENSFLTENNGDTFGGLRLGGSASAKILYSTIALNSSIVPPIDCGPGWSGKLELRNSAVVDAGAHFGPGCNGKEVKTHTYEEQVSDKNLLKGTTFNLFTEGVYTALENGNLMGQALWKAGDPVADYDETPRPTTADPALDYAGADRPGL